MDVEYLISHDTRSAPTSTYLARSVRWICAA
jgi:hypothetical protein